MNSVPSKLENKGFDPLYRKNQVKSVSFLIILGGVLLLTILKFCKAARFASL